MDSKTNSVCLSYLLLLTKYALQDSFLNFPFIASSLFMLLYSLILTTHISPDNLKFIAHSLFASIVIIFFCDLVALVYNILFYFGFVNTIIFVKFIIILFGSEIPDNIASKLSEYRLFRYITQKVINLCSKLVEMFYRYNVHIYVLNYLWNFTKYLFGKLTAIHYQLSDNSRTRLVQNKLIAKYGEMSSHVMSFATQSYVNTMFSNQEKNPSSNISMSFLSNTKVEEIDDDLDDEPTETVAHVVEPTPEPVEMSKDERRAILKKKCAAKRKGLRENKHNPREMQANAMNMKNMMNTPLMKQMMESMLKDDGLKNMMSQVSSPNQMNFDTTQLNEILQGVMSPKN